jgi:Glycosyl hydrolases family 25
MSLHGFDISAYQSTTAPAADFVIVKATEGASYSSSRFAAQWASAKSKAKHRGAYHFARPEDSSATSQAARFLSVVKPVRGESVWLDLEASDLNQSQTNTWAKSWGDYIRQRAPGVTSGIYMGSGYASNGTGRDLNQHFDLWWYPQYPSTAKTSTWRSAFSPWLPGGLTCGWAKPHIWQFTSNFNGIDANLGNLTLDELAGGGQDPEDDDMYAQAAGYPPPMKVGERHTHSCPKGKIDIVGVVFDSPHKLTYRFAFHYKSGHGNVATLTVGGPASASDSWPVKPTYTVPQVDKVDQLDWFSIELVSCEGPTPDWDPTMPDINGKLVFPGWDASHTA